MSRILIVLCASLTLIGCVSNDVSLKPQTPEAWLMADPCHLQTEPVSNTDELLAQDQVNWQCAGTWLQQTLGLQEYIKLNQNK